MCLAIATPVVVLLRVVTIGVQAAALGAATTIRLAMRLKTRNRRIVRVGPAEELDFTHADLVGHRGILAFFTTA